MTDEELKPRGSTGKYKSRHGMYGTKLYHIWNGIRNRCLNPKNKDYANYGGRGIDICPEWNEPEKFFGWAFLNGYSVDMSLDRIDNNKGYSPDNCRWVLLTEQQRNKRNNHIIEYDGESHCIAEWAEITGINKQTILSRLRYGWTIKDVLSIKPSHQNKSRRYNAELTQRIQMAKPRTVTQYFLSGANNVGVLRISLIIITIFTV